MIRKKAGRVSEYPAGRDKIDLLIKLSIRKGTNDADIT